MRLALVGVEARETTQLRLAGGDVPAEHAIRGFHGVTLLLREAAPTAAVLTDVLGFAETGREGALARSPAARRSAAS